jgi:hypothetical protein
MEEHEQNLENFFQDRIQDYFPTWTTPISGSMGRGALVFRRFSADLYTQKYQDPLGREGAEQLALRTAALRELEDEERRETGGRELARPLTLYHEDGSLVECRSGTGTRLSVSALE